VVIEVAQDELRVLETCEQRSEILRQQSARAKSAGAMRKTRDVRDGAMNGDERLPLQCKARCDCPETSS